MLSPQNSNSLVEWGFLALLLASIAGFTAMQKRRARNRAAAIAEISGQLGFTFQGDDWSHGTRAPQLETPLFEHDGSVSNILSGTRFGLDVSFFDYSFRSGRNSYAQTVAAFSQEIWLPTFQLVPKGLLGFLSPIHSRRQIQFESNPEFSKRFVVVSEDELKVRTLFSAELLADFANRTAALNWHMEGAGSSIFIFRLGNRVKPEDFSEFVEFTANFASNFFRHSGLKKPESIDIFAERRRAP